MIAICLFRRIISRPTAVLSGYSLIGDQIITPHVMELSTSSTCHEKYEEAIAKLNSLQSNAQTLEVIRKKREEMAYASISSTEKYLKRVGIDSQELGKLSVIHVAGTKGKGSTCAFVESILSEYGYKVGLYTSPHLVVARERIRIGGQMISETMFTKYFWEAYNILKEEQDSASDMPAYFRFLTVLAIKVFLEEKVDVAVLEVGIGGEYDCTNVVKTPVVCGITSLDMDHTSILGNTIDSVAWHKAGIMKKGVTTYTVDQHHLSSYEVLQNRASEKKATLLKVPALQEYNRSGQPLYLGLSGSVQFVNASLALQLAHHWLRKDNNPSKPEIAAGLAHPFKLSEQDMNGLKNVVWPGRSQVIKDDSCTYYIDGAHTSISMLACIDWFSKASKQEDPNRNALRILMFNITGERNPRPLLENLFSLHFDVVVFCTNLVTKHLDARSDQKRVGVSEDSQIYRCHQLKRTWQSILEEKRQTVATPAHVFDCTTGALSWLRNPTNFKDFPAYNSQNFRIQVLVTGSLHLVGAFLAVADPSLSIRQVPKQKKSLKEIIKNRQISSKHGTR